MRLAHKLLGVLCRHHRCGSHPQPYGAQGRVASAFVYQFKALFPSSRGAGAAVQRFLGCFQMPEPYLLDVQISGCIMVAWHVFF